MEDPVRHADYRFRSRVRAWRWRRALWGGLVSRPPQRADAQLNRVYRSIIQDT